MKHNISDLTPLPYKIKVKKIAKYVNIYINICTVILEERT